MLGANAERYSNSATVYVNNKQPESFFSNANYRVLKSQTERAPAPLEEWSRINNLDHTAFADSAIVVWGVKGTIH